MSKAVEIHEVMAKLRDGEVARRDAFTLLIEHGCTLVGAAERVSNAGNGRGSGGAGVVDRAQSPRIDRLEENAEESVQDHPEVCASNHESSSFGAAFIPIFYNGLVVEKTTRCNAKCAMCYQSAGPKGSDLLGIAELTAEEIARLVVEAAEIDVISPRFHLSGGEAFLDIEGCIELFAVARAAGFLDIMTTTNAYWARTEERARNICLRLREAGLTRMEISWDVWHLPFIQPAVIGNCIRACRSANIEVLLRILSSKSHSYQEALDFIPDEDIELVNSVMCGPVLPTGRAAEAIDPDEFHGSGDLDDNCHSFLSLTIGPTGEVSPCCAGLDHTEARLCGNVRERSLASIVSGMNASPLVRTLVFGGVSRLRPILEDRGFSLESDYRSICHMCWSVFSNPDHVQALKSHFAELQGRLVGAHAAYATWNLNAREK